MKYLNLEPIVLWYQLEHLISVTFGRLAKIYWSTIFAGQRDLTLFTLKHSLLSLRKLRAYSIRGPKYHHKMIPMTWLFQCLRNFAWTEHLVFLHHRHRNNWNTECNFERRTTKGINKAKLGSIWKHDYLKSLQPGYKWQKTAASLRPNDMVFCSWWKTVPLQWPLGRVTNIITANANVACVQKLERKNGLGKDWWSN